MLPEITNVNGVYVRLDGSSAAWALALGRTLGCPLGSPQGRQHSGPEWLRHCRPSRPTGPWRVICPSIEALRASAP